MGRNKPDPLQPCIYLRRLQMRNLAFYSLCLTILMLSSCSKLTKALKEPSPEKRYEIALGYYEAEDYGRAGIVFEDLIPDIYGKTMAERVQFYYAYCHYHQKQYDLAEYYFKNFHDTYQRSPFAIEALFMHAYSLYESTPQYNLDQGNTDRAIQELQEFINRYPESNYVAQATAAIRDLRAKLERKSFEVAKLYEQLRRYKSAVIAYESFRQSYPDSEYREEAAFRKIRSQYELSKLSFNYLKEERYEEVIKLYLKFVDRYSESAFLKEAEKYYEGATKELQDIRAQKAAAKAAAAESN